MNKEFYNTPRHNAFLLQYEDNREIKDYSYLQDVIDLCLHTEVCKVMNLSLLDLMHMDYPTYMQIRDMMLKDKQEKIKEMERSQKDLEDRSRSFLEGASNGSKRQ